MKTYLDKIVQTKKEEVNLAKKQAPLASFDSNVEPKRDFLKAMQQKPAIIAEIKKASPSKGVICQNFDVAKTAMIYEQHGARCLSVLTDKPFFQGDPSYIALAKESSSLPVLRKDFIIDEYQIHESNFLNADCILLIVAILDDQQLQDFCTLAQASNMAVVVEVHDENELNRALVLPTPLIGINNRNLQTFHTDLNISVELAQKIPKDKIIISESGISSKADLLHLRQCGIDSFLIGESFMKSANPGELLAQFINN